MMARWHQLERKVVIRAAREAVFRYFTDSARWAKWWGPGSTIDAQSGGRMYIRYPNGVEVSGEVLEVSAPERIVFTYGYVSGNPIAPGASRVTLVLEEHEGGTMVCVGHEFAEASVLDAHTAGWRFQLSLFANVVADEIFADSASVVDRWFAAWAMANDGEREKALGALAKPGVRFQDRFAVIEGLAELSAHVGASLCFMPGIRMERKGEVRHCQGNLLANWVALGPDGAERTKGANLFVLTSHGRIDSVIGFSG